MYSGWTTDPDPLAVHRLPTGADSPDGCELNERVGELPRRAATREAARLLCIAALAAAAVGVGPRYAGGAGGSSDGRFVWAACLAGSWGAAVAYALAGSPWGRRWAAVGAVWVAAGAVLRVQADAPDARAGYPLTFPLAVAACGLLAHLVAAQYAHYAAAGLANEWDVSAAWRDDWDGFAAGRRTPHRPELAAARRAAAALIPAVAVGWVGVVEWDLAGAAGYLLGLLLLAPAVWPRGTDPGPALAAGWRAVRVFLTYERRPCPAPGAFRFPTRWLRPHGRRFVVTLAALALAAVSVGTGLPAARPQPPAYPVPEQPPFVPETLSRPPMTRAEAAYFDRLAGDFPARQHYLSVLRSRRAADQVNFRRAGENYARSALVTAAAGVALPPAVAFATLVFLYGPALAAYRDALDRS